jgi:hypothetical protein
VSDEGKQHHAADYDQYSHHCDSHFVPSLHTATPSHPLSGQRKPFMLPSNRLVLTSFGVIQNLWPQLGQVRRYRCSMLVSRASRDSSLVLCSNRLNSLIPSGPRTKTWTPHGSQVKYGLSFFVISTSLGPVHTGQGNICFPLINGKFPPDDSHRSITREWPSEA